ncbi:MAG: hypothetical protein ACFB4I_10495 [Cyanophyceae cyanobacterium]
MKSSTDRLSAYLPGILLAGTAIALTHSFSFGMAGLTTFFLAYISKGARSYRYPQKK